VTDFNARPPYRTGICTVDAERDRKCHGDGARGAYCDGDVLTRCWLRYAVQRVVCNPSSSWTCLARDHGFGECKRGRRGDDGRGRLRSWHLRSIPEFGESVRSRLPRGVPDV